MVVAVLIPGGCSFQMELVPETSLKVHGHLSLLHLLSERLGEWGRGGGSKSCCRTAKSYVEVEAIVLILLRNKHTHM